MSSPSTTTGLSRPQTTFAFRRQPVDLSRVAVLLFKWPMIAFRFLRRGRFAAIAELRRDSAKLLGRHEESLMNLQNLEEEQEEEDEQENINDNSTDPADSFIQQNKNDPTIIVKRKRLNLATALASMGNASIAFSWAFILLTLLGVSTILPQFTQLVSVFLIIGPCIAIIITLSSITRDSAKYTTSSEQQLQQPNESTLSSLITDFLGGIFFVFSSFPFALPWVIAFFFPYECLLFFSAWAVFGAIINEVAVLVSHNQIMRGGLSSNQSSPKSPTFSNSSTSLDGSNNNLLNTSIGSNITTTSSNNNGETTMDSQITKTNINDSNNNTQHQQTRPTLPIKRKRKTTAQRLATVSNFTDEDREELEEFLVSSEGLRWWGAFLGMQGMISAGSVFLALAAELWLVGQPGLESWTFFAMVMSSCGLMESFWMTYAVGGRWLHFRQKWRFFQPFKGGKQFVLLNSFSWFLFFTSLLTMYRDMGPSFTIITNQIYSSHTNNNNSQPWYIHAVKRYVFDIVYFLCHIIGLNYFPRGFGAVAGVFAELILLVSLPLYKGEINEHYLFASTASSRTLTTSLHHHENNQQLNQLHDELLDVTEEHENELYPITITNNNNNNTDQHPKEIQEELRAARNKIRKMKKSPIKSQLFVPLWEFCADALRTAWLAPIVLTLTKPEVVLFLVGFFMTKFVHGIHFPTYLTDHYPFIFSPNATFDYPTALIGVEILYLLTYRGNPSRTGRRRAWNWRGTWVYDELAAHFYTHIIREQELNPAERHIFGYIPHGMFPMAASYLHNTTQWMKLFPGIVCVSLVATITHIVPFLREITQYNGGIEVTANSFTNALRTFRNVFLVPGGQHEMLLMPTPKRDLSGQPDGEYLPVSTKHKGFIKLALLSAAGNPEDPVNLVPMYTFGESDTLFNAFPASIALQRWLVSKFRTNPAFLPVGRFYLAGVPKRVPVTVVIGPPLRVPVVNGIPTEEQIDLLHRRFYSSVGEVFRRNRGLCDGYENSEIEFHPKLSPPHELSQHDFIVEWKKIAHQNAGLLSEIKIKKDPPPIGEYIVTILMSQAALWGPYWFFG
jgi:hypothetical protein